MSIGCSIYFMPVDGSWVGTPEFIQGMAGWLELDTFDTLRVYREAPSVSESKPHPELEDEKYLEEHAVSVDRAIAAQRTGDGFTTVVTFGTGGTVEKMFQDVTATLPKSLSEGFAPVEGSLYNGPWKHYDYNTGAQLSASACCLILTNNLGYPVELDAYLAAFLKVPSVVRLQQQLETLSGQNWHALIDLT